jgi:hypothetical protein
MTVVLTVMSGMGPHMIRVTWIGMVGRESVSLVLRSSYRSGLCGMFDVASRREELLALVIAAWHRRQPPLSTSQTTVSLPMTKAPMSSFPPLAEYQP